MVFATPPIRNRNYRIGASRGIGAAPSTPSQVTAAQTAGLVATGVATTGGILSSTALLGTAAIPIIGPIFAAVAAAIPIIENLLQGCGNTCIQASNIANQIGDAMTLNLNTYLAVPLNERYASVQQAALANFDTLWGQLVQACSAVQGSAGSNCVSQRQEGACYFKSSPGGWQGTQYVRPGAEGSGTACWNYFIGMRDPIANDPNVIPDPTTVAGAVTQATSDLSSMGIMGIGLAAIALIGGLIMVED